MTDLIKRAVELADGWSVHGGWGTTALQEHTNQKALDALAAQLVRQVDATDNYWVQSDDEQVAVLPKWCDPDTHDTPDAFFEEGPDRTMNTIKAIVESGILDD